MTYEAAHDQRTAEEMLESIRAGLQSKADIAARGPIVYKGLIAAGVSITYEGLADADHELLATAALDEAHELARAVAALDIALEVLRRRAEPMRDEERG